MLLTGPSGVGKTALIEQALDRLGRHDDTTIWRGRCHERERVPYRAFDFVIDDLATELAGEKRLASSIEHAGALARVFPALAPIIDPAHAAVPPAEDLRVERERALIAMTALFRNALATTTRAILVIDDLQWADDDSLALLALLVERIARPLTIVATWTTQDELPERSRALIERLGTAADVIAIAPMAPAELAEVIADFAPQAPAERLRAAADLAAGSPYLAELIGRELAEAGHADLQDAERRRLDRLGQAERAVAEITSLAGGTATFEQLRALAELPSVQLQSALRGLEDGRVVRATPAATGEPVYVFYHQRLRDAAAVAIEPATRRTLHRRFAELFERDRATPDQLAYHWLEAGEPSRAAHWAIVAADAARAQLAWSLAADWFGRALELALDNPTIDLSHAKLREQRADALFLAGKLAAAAADFEILARAPDGDRWHVRAAESYIKLGELERGLAILGRVLARRGAPLASSLADPSGSAWARATSAARALGVTAGWMIPRTLRRRGSADEVVASSYRVIASFLSTPYPLESFEYVVRGITIAERAGDHAAQSLGMAMLAAYLAAGSLGRFGDRAIASAQRLSVESGAPYPRMVAAGAAGILATLRGNWAGMRIAHDEGAQICKRLGMERSWEASFLSTYHALGEYYAGDPAKALAMLDELVGSSDDLISRAMLGSYRGRALLLAGDLAPARVLERELAAAPAARRGLAAIYRQVFAGELALAEHDWTRAAALGEELARSARAQWLSAMPAVSAMIDVVIATAEIGAGDRRAAERARERARGLYRRGRWSFYAPVALRLWGQAEARLGGSPTSLYARARELADTRGSKVEQLVLAGLTGEPRSSGPLAAAVTWSSGGVVT